MWGRYLFETLCDNFCLVQLFLLFFALMFSVLNARLVASNKAQEEVPGQTRFNFCYKPEVTFVMMNNSAQDVASESWMTGKNVRTCKLYPFTTYSTFFGQ